MSRSVQAGAAIDKGDTQFRIKCSDIESLSQTLFDGWSKRIVISIVDWSGVELADIVSVPYSAIHREVLPADFSFSDQFFNWIGCDALEQQFMDFLSWYDGNIDRGPYSFTQRAANLRKDHFWFIKPQSSQVKSIPYFEKSETLMMIIRSAPVHKWLKSLVWFSDTHHQSDHLELRADHIEEY